MAEMTVEQLKAALGEIATTAGTLASFTRQSLADAGCTEAADQFHIAAMLAERIGALADYAIGESFFGDQGAWILGPNFHDKGPSSKRGKS